MIRIDGSMGEGGGQIVRSSLALSMLTAQPVRIHKIRGNRRKPGLKRQHLTGVLAAAAVCDAEIDGAELDASTLTFAPRAITGGDYRFDIGSAGSVMLVLQTVLPALLKASSPSSVTVTGGTHNGLSPPWPFFEACFLPALRSMGVTVRAVCPRAGFYPAGGGRVTLHVEPIEQLEPLRLEDLGEAPTLTATALVSKLPRRVGEDQIAWLAARTELEQTEVHEVPEPLGPGNAVFIHARGDQTNQVFSGFGDRRRRGVAVASQALQQLLPWLSAGVPVDEHLADQLLLPLLLAGAGAFRTTAPSLHTTTNIDVIHRFTGVRLRTEKESAEVWWIGH